MTNLDRVLAAIRHTEEDIAQEYTLSALARSVYFSPFHFHRLFVSIVGKTPAAYVRLRRLTRAVEDLVGTVRPISDIAVAYGFETQQSFTRAFGEEYGVTPFTYRRAGRFVPLCCAFTERDLRLRIASELTSAAPVITGIREFIIASTLVYGKHRGDIAGCRQHFVQREDELRSGVKGKACELHLYPDEAAEDGRLYCLTGLAVTEVAAVGDAFCAKVLPACDTQCSPTAFGMAVTARPTGESTDGFRHLTTNLCPSTFSAVMVASGAMMILSPRSTSTYPSRGRACLWSCTRALPQQRI